MADFNSTQPSFSAGVLSQELFSRIDYSKLSSGLERCENWFIRPAGGAEFRPGTKYIDKTKNNDTNVVLIPFVENTTQSWCLEFGVGYIRFYKDALAVYDSSGERLEVSTGYTSDELKEIKYVQHKNQLFLVHKNHPPKVLTRNSDTDWTFVTMELNPTVVQVESVSLSKASAKDPNSVVNNDWSYAVSVVDSDGNEGLATKSASINSDVDLLNQPITVSFNAPSGCKEGYKFYIYRIYQGEYCLVWKIDYVVGTSNYSFKDTSYAANSSHTIKEKFTSFDDGNYPSAIGFFKQRLVFANTPKGPNTIYGSCVGTFDDFTTTPSNNADEAFELELNSNTSDTITDLIQMDDLIVITQNKIWRVVGTSASDMAAYVESFSGSSGLPPHVTKKTILYVESSKNKVSNFVYSYELNGYVGQQLDILCRTFFDEYEITDISLRENPYAILFCVRDDGALLGLTYLREENIYAWHIHTTSGKFKNVCVTTKDKNDFVYVVVERDGFVSVECFSNPLTYSGDKEDTTSSTYAWYLDCAARLYSNENEEIVISDGKTQISGLDRFNGKKIYVLADGNVFEDIPVEDGVAEIYGEFSVYLLGLPYVGYLLPIPIESKFNSGSTTVGINRRINKASIRLNKTRGLLYGTSYEKLFEIKPYSQETFAEEIPLESGTFNLEVQDTYKQEAKFIISQKYPLPALVQSVTLELYYGQKN